MGESGCLNCRLLTTFMSLLMFLIALTLKINQTWAHVSWFLIFLPLWIVNGISFCIILYLIFGKRWLTKKENLGQIICYTLSLTSLCLFEILLCMKLQWKEMLPYWVIFLPLWIFMFCIFYVIAQHLYRICQTNVDKAM